MLTFEGRKITLVSRNDWHARKPRSEATGAKRANRKEFIVHHSGASASQSVHEIQSYHMDTKGWVDIGYNFLIDQHGKLYTGRGMGRVGAHAQGHNTAGIGVCVIGKNQLSGPARTSLRYIYQDALRYVGHALTIKGHSAVGTTDCPGDRIRAWLAHGWLDPRALSYRRAGGVITTTGEDVRDVQRELAVRGLLVEPDGAFGPLTDAAVRRYQASRGLDDDGIVGPLTRTALNL